MIKNRIILYLIIVSLFVLTNIIGCTNNNLGYKKDLSKDTELFIQEIEKINI